MYAIIVTGGKQYRVEQGDIVYIEKLGVEADSEDVYKRQAQPLVLAEEEDTKKNSSVTSYFTDALFTELVQDIMDKENISESEAQKLLYTGGFTVESTVNTKVQSAMENLMLNTDDAYFPAGWHEEEVTSISDDDVQVMNEDGTPKTRTGDDGTVYYYRNVRTQAAMVTLDYDGNVIAIVGGLGEKNKSLSLNRAYRDVYKRQHQLRARYAGGGTAQELLRTYPDLGPVPRNGRVDRQRGRADPQRHLHHCGGHWLP